MSPSPTGRKRYCMMSPSRWRKTGCWPWWGPPAAVKSTVANLLSRFWDVKQGQILVRGRDIRDIPLSDLMDQISMVFQRVYSIPGYRLQQHRHGTDRRHTGGGL